MDKHLSRFKRLTPFVSTCFRYVEENEPGLQKGKVYKIEGWYVNKGLGQIYLQFICEEGDMRKWFADNGVVDISFKENLKKILE